MLKEDGRRKTEEWRKIRTEPKASSAKLIPNIEARKKQNSANSALSLANSQREKLSGENPELCETFATLRGVLKKPYFPIFSFSHFPDNQ
jgi:hypothetical protein